jgi:hypothetical protein
VDFPVFVAELQDSCSAARRAAACIEIPSLESFVHPFFGGGCRVHAVLRAEVHKAASDMEPVTMHDELAAVLRK